MTERKELLVRCPRLGDEMSFEYCAREGGDIPCQRIVYCWQTFFPVEEWLRKSLSPEKWDRFVNGRPGGKIAALVELVEKARGSTD